MSNMKQGDFLVEIGTEELPPKALKKLSTAFTQGINNGLSEANLGEGIELISYAAPRRLAVHLKNVPLQQENQDVEKRGPSVSAAFDDEGNPSRAAMGFASSCGTTIDKLDRLKTDKGEWLMFNESVVGQATAQLLPEIINQSLAKLPIPKRMRWGANPIEFVRPAQWILLIDDNGVIDAEILGLKTSNTTRGHRFHANETFVVNAPKDYADILLSKGHVVASFEDRREQIITQAKDAAKTLGGKVVLDTGLLDEVTALVESPHAVSGGFEEQFLNVPQECLISSMQDHQKYFPVVDAKGKLMPNFITISNIDSKDVSKVREGNERVIRPRFSDAMFFWKQDRKQTLASRRDSTKNIVFQEKLGTLFEKTERVAEFASKIAGANVNAKAEDVANAQQAAELCKCDLVSDMVNEFPELQGIMGQYYAQNDGEPSAVADAIKEHYQPRFAGDDIPQSNTGKAVALADKLDTLVGIFSIGMKPTGSKDPFSLRRAGLGVQRILIEGKIGLDLKELLNISASTFNEDVSIDENNIDEIFKYIMERLPAYYKDQGIRPQLVDATSNLNISNPLDFDARINAVNDFMKLDEAESLVAANKRISNILKKAPKELPATNATLFEEAAEKQLAVTLEIQKEKVAPLLQEKNYSAALTQLSTLRPEIDAFFDSVMVMADNDAIKNNRLALLTEFRMLFLNITDLSTL